MALGDGEILGLIGPNSAGKTTLLRVLAGVHRPDSGRVLFGEIDVSDRLSLERRLAGLGYVPQERIVFPNLTVHENLETAYRAAAGRPLHFSLEERFDFVYRLFPQLAERKSQEAGLMSGGEQRMVGIAIGLMLRPRILLLDEPTTGLAPMVVQLFMKTIQQLRDAEGMSILIVEQNIASLVRVVDRLCLMKAGQCSTFEGRPEQLAQQNIWEYL